MLLKSDETQLYEQLGMRAKAIEQNPSKAGLFDPEVTYDYPEMGLKDDIYELGQRLFRRWNREAYSLVCGSETKDTKERENLTKAIGVTDAAVAAVLSGMLVTTFGLGTSDCSSVAAIEIKRFCRPSYEETCQVWKKHIAE